LTAAAAHHDARCSGRWPRLLGLRTELRRPAGAAAGDAGGRRDLHAAGGHHRGLDRGGKGKGERHRVRFLGWSLAIAGGLPLVTFVAAHFGWRAVFGVATAIAVIPCVLLSLTLPRGLRGKLLLLKSSA